MTERAVINTRQEPNGSWVAVGEYRSHEIASGEWPTEQEAIAKVAQLAMEMWVDATTMSEADMVEMAKHYDEELGSTERGELVHRINK